MDPVSEKFLALLWRGLSLPAGDGCPGVPLSDEEWRSVYLMSLKQAVCGIVWTAVEDLPEGFRPPEDVAAAWKRDVGIIGRDYDKVEKVVEMQRRAWTARGVDAVLLKGPESAKMYPRPERRMSGDIDWWMPTDKDWTKALELVERNGLKWEKDSDGDIHYVLNGIVVEHHRRGLEVPGPVGELLLRCEHVLHHAMVTGVGLKQICDYLVALRFYEGKYDREEYDGELEKRGLLEWERRLAGLDPGLLELVLSDGNMGFGKKDRFGGFFHRLRYFLPVCPGLFFRRWSGLVFGHLAKKI